MDAALLFGLIAACAPQVDSITARAIVETESAANPHAIGVVGGALDRQPRHQAEAIATARALLSRGWTFSVGLSQINARNFERLGLTLEAAFDPCANLRAMQTLLVDCLDRAHANEAADQKALRLALSCYYSGNFTTGFERGYVQRVARAAVSRSHPLAPSKEY